MPGPYGEEVVGETVWVHWKDGKRLVWFEGVVQSFDEDAGAHTIAYKIDGEEVETDLVVQENDGLLSWTKPADSTSPAKKAVAKKPAAKKSSEAKQPAAKRARVQASQRGDGGSSKAGSSEGEEEDGGEAAPAPTASGRVPRRAAVKAAHAYAKMAKGSDDDDSEFSHDEEDEDEEEEEDDDDSVSSGRGKRKRKQPTKPRAKSAGAKTSGAKPLGKQPVGVSFRKPKAAAKGPKKARPKKQGSQPFVDPAGLDIEDRGVEWIVEAQVRPRPRR